MTTKKYISTKDAVRLTGLSTQEIYDLIHSGKLTAHKAPKSGWRIAPQDLAELGLIHEESEPIVEETQTGDGILYVADEEHYTEVFRRMTKVKHSLKIATANLKNFNVTIETGDGEENTSPVRILPKAGRTKRKGSGGVHEAFRFLPVR